MELNPTSPELMVCQALVAATNPDHEIVRKAEIQLAEWELEPGFFPTLARLCMLNNAQQADINVRWMAAVYLKNGVNKYWRRGTRRELPPEEKQQIRELLLNYFGADPVPQVMLQVAVLIARIARSDCPRDWPELLPQLLKRLQSFEEGGVNHDDSEQQRVMLVFHHVVKALASRRTMADKRIFEEFAENIFLYLEQLWDKFTTTFFQQLESTPTLAMSTLERALLTMRILRKLAIYGFARPYKSQCCMRFLEQLFVRLKQCLECRYKLQHVGADEQMITLLEKLILKQMKTLNEFQDMHSVSFTRFVPVALEFSFNHVFHDNASLIFTDNVINFSNFAIHCINMMKGILMSALYSSITVEDIPELTTSIMLSDFFTNERLCYICEKLIMHYFVLTKIELESWNDDPEGFSQDDGGESWKYSLRPCVETFYITCFTEYQAQMVTEVSKYIRKAQQTVLSPSSDLKDILLKDAIYNAAGLAPFQFFYEIEFDDWFKNQLIAELRIDSDNFRILRRRIIWLVAEWAGVKFSRDQRPLAYEACLHLLRPVEDMSIRLAASRTISTLIGDFEFAPEAFLPYLEPTFSSLFVVLGEAKECDTKMKVLTSMSLIVEKMGDHIEPQMNKFIAYLPMLWKESETFNMLRCAIISTLQQIVKAIRHIPEALKPFLYSIIALSTDLQEPSHIYLLEEGLALWVGVVENSTAISPQLIELCKNIFPIVEMSSENLRTVLMLIQAYILLDAHAFLDLYGQQFVAFCLRMFDDIRSEGIILMVKVFELMLKSDPNYGLEFVRPSLPYFFRHVYLDKEYPNVLGMYLTMIARVLLINQSVFMAVLQDLNMPNAVEKILDVWTLKMPLITETEKRKLFCLAFGSIFANNSIILERFPLILQNISVTLVEVMREEDDGEQDEGVGDKATIYCDSLVFLDESDLDTSNYCTMDDFDYKTYHYDRCRQLSLRDPVHKIKLHEYIEWQINMLRQQMNNEAYQELMRTVCGSTLQKLGKFIKLNLNFIPKRN